MLDRTQKLTGTLLSLCLCASVVISLSCGSKPTDPRTVIPADSLVYLETSDLGKVLDAMTSNPKFQQLAKTKPDFSALDGIRLSVAVTGFQTSEEELTDENAILNFQPRFVAVAETNAWNYQALGFTENKLGEFVNDAYGGGVELVTTDKHGGKYFVWTAQDGRHAYALVAGSLIFFGNDESAIEKCVNVRNGDGESISKNARVAAFPPTSLASGYISKDGIAQIANIASISLAMGASEEGEVQSFIARVLPEIVRNAVTEATWTARRLEDGRIEDSYTFSLAPDTAKVLGETIVPNTDPDAEQHRFIPKEFVSATRYNLKDAQIAWRSVLLTARTNTDQVSGNLLTAFSSSLFEPYAIEDPELFLSAIDSPVKTIRFDAEGDEVSVIARIKDLEKLKQSVARELNIARSPSPRLRAKPPTKLESFDTWYSDDGELAVAIVEDTVIIGDAGSIEKCLTAESSGQNLFPASNAAVVTAGTETDPEAKLITVLAERKEANEPLVQAYTTETRFNQNGMERQTVSDFGLIGAIIGQIGSDR